MAPRGLRDIYRNLVLSDWTPQATALTVDASCAAPAAMAPQEAPIAPAAQVVKREGESREEVREEGSNVGDDDEKDEKDPSCNKGKGNAWKKRRQSLKDMDINTEGDDIKIARLITQLRALEAQQVARVKAEEYEQAHEINVELTSARKALAAMEVCPGCWIAKPSARAVAQGPERWARGGAVDFCGHCGGRAAEQIRAGIRSHADAVGSLRRRTLVELEMALQLEEQQFPRAKGITVVAVRSAKKALPPPLRGTIIRWKKKELSREWVIAQLYRTRARLVPEDSLQRERRALGLALVMLDAL